MNPEAGIDLPLAGVNTFVAAGSDGHDVWPNDSYPPLFAVL